MGLPTMLPQAVPVHHYADLPVDQLFTDSTYQRDLRDAKLRRIVQNFDPDALGVLYVSQRSPTSYAVIDGQHRLEALRQLGVQVAPCFIYQELSLEQEARMFWLDNSERYYPAYADVIKARLIAHEPVAMALHDVLAEYNLQIHEKKGRRMQAGFISAGHTIEEMYRRGGVNHIRDVFDIIEEAWGFQEVEATKSRMLQGISLFVSYYNRQYNRKRFVMRLSAVTPGELVRKAHAHVDTIVGKGLGRSEITALVKAMVANYNFQLSTTRLEDYDPPRPYKYTEPGDNPNIKS